MTITREQAHALASDLHEGQFDKGGAPYIRHPEAVSLALAPFGLEAEIIGLLHDVIEDTEATVADLLAAGVPGVCVRSVLDLSRPEAKAGPRLTYQEWVTSLTDPTRYGDEDLVPSATLSEHGLNSDARIPRTVLAKIADNGHNVRADRMASLDPEVAKGMTRRYTRSLRTLMGSLDDQGAGRMVLERVNPAALALLAG